MIFLSKMASPTGAVFDIVISSLSVSPTSSESEGVASHRNLSFFVVNEASSVDEVCSSIRTHSNIGSPVSPSMSTCDHIYHWYVHVISPSRLNTSALHKRVLSVNAGSGVIITDVLSC